MKCLYGMLLLFITIFKIDSVKSDLIDIAIPTVFGSKDKQLLSCYDCYNATNPECNSMQNTTGLITECREDAKGCVKKFYTDDGYLVMSRECYYGPLKFIRDLSCEGTKHQYPQQKCHLCTENLCNSSTKLYPMSHIVLSMAIFLFIQVLKFF